MTQPGAAGDRRGSGPEDLTIGADHAIPAHAQRWTARDGTRNTLFSIDDAGAAALRAATTFGMRLDRLGQVTIDAGDLAKAMATLDACATGRNAAWGLDPDQRDKIATPARPVGKPQGDWLDGAAMPAAEMAKLDYGVTAVLYAIETDGRIKRCWPIRSSGSAWLDTQSCTLLMRNARSTPAIGKDGAPMVVHAVRRIPWRSWP